MGRSARRTVLSVSLALSVVVGVAAAKPAGAAPKDPLVYVALGDSYTSGPLVLPHDTTFVSQDCGQSIYNYPHLAARQIHADVFRDLSCSSATINDFTRTQRAAAGSRVQPQFNALTKDTDVVTLGIGGNDVGFVGLAIDCLRFSEFGVGRGPCTPNYVHDGVDTISRKIKAMGDDLGVALDQIHVKSPHAKVLVVSYPAALPDDGFACWPYAPILPADMPYLTAKYKEMNSELATTAATHRSEYVDIYASGIGHDICQLPARAWVNAAVVIPPSFPAHPNVTSFRHSAPVVARAIQAALR